jgi:predicted membrane channel-forming protein YqfA (hemolysin III family)
MDVLPWLAIECYEKFNNIDNIDNISNRCLSSIMNIIMMEKFMSTTVILFIAMAWLSICLAVSYTYAMRKLDKSEDTNRTS